MRFESKKMRYTNAKSTWQDEESEHHIKVDREIADHIIFAFGNHTCRNDQNGQDQLVLIIFFLDAPIYNDYVYVKFLNHLF